MFEKKLYEIVEDIKESLPFFNGKGFVKNTKIQGGFSGITDEHKNYFYAYYKSDESDVFSFSESERNGILNVSFEFRIVVDINGCSDNLSLILFNEANKIANVTVESFTHEDGFIYKRETGTELKKAEINLFSFDCRYENNNFDLTNELKCLEQKEIVINKCF